MIGSITKFITNLVGKKSDKDIKFILPLVDEINKEFAPLASKSNDELRALSASYKKEIAEYIAPLEKEAEKYRTDANNLAAENIQEKEKLFDKADALKKDVNTKIEEKLLELLPKAFALLKETAKRFKENEEITSTATEFDKQISTFREHMRIDGDKVIYKNRWLAAGNEIKWDMVHYDVQLIGGVVLHQGKVSEMATGEGKTLVATLPVFLNALAGKGVHLVTVNNYLSRRDSEWMGPIMEWHGLSVDCIDKHEPNSDARRNAYLADITYGTNNEFGFDYLRDNMVRTPAELVQRPHHFAIVDEVDSVLIDDARTPLIISGPTGKDDKHEFFDLKPKIEKIVNAQKALINIVLADSKKLIAENDTEKGGAALLRAYRGLPKNKALIKFLSEPGMKALLQKTENYYMQDHNREMHKIDVDLYFVIDEKNNSIELTERGIDLITNNTDDGKFFIIPDMGSILPEIDKLNLSPQEKLSKKDELIRDFSIKSERIHTVNQLLKAYALFEKDVEYVVMDNKVKIVDEQTGRILDGRRYSDGLHQAIEAKENVHIEASTQTWATITLQNYFRMYHKLCGMTGTAETEASELWDIYKLDVVVIPTNRLISRKDMDDKVYKTKREKYNAVIIQIEEYVTAGRPVLVGTTSVEVSELLSRMLKLRNIKHNVLNAKLHQREAEIVQEAGRAGTVTIATNMAGRGTDIKLGEGVKEAGGLAIIGTERHESRRVDRQLRGRAGRQGDPGTSQFFVCLEDDLMRLFGSDRIARLMDSMGIEEGEVIQHAMITKSIERAQKKVEENNFGVRKRLLEYDDVMNAQREVIYKKRRNALFGDRLSVDINNMIYDASETLVNESKEQEDFRLYEVEVLKQVGIEPPFNEESFLAAKTEDVVQTTFNKAEAHYLNKAKTIQETSFPTIKNVYENHGNQYHNIAIPFTDGIKNIQIITELKKAYETQGADVFKSFEKAVTLNLIDDEWKEHLREMDELKQSVQNAVYEQKDPLLVYKFESFELFKQMMNRVNKDIVTLLMRGTIFVEEKKEIAEVKEVKEIKQAAPRLTAGRDEVAPGAPALDENGEPQKPKQTPVKAEQKIGRNDPCPCGSGKKYKSCHGVGVA